MDVAGISFPRGKLTKDKKQKALDDALDWLRNNNVSAEDLDDPTLQALANISGMPMPSRTNTSSKRVF